MATEYRRQQQLRGTAAQWTSNDVVVLAGEIALQTGPGTGEARAKIGDGVTAFSALPWVFEVDAVARQSISDLTAVTVTLDSRVTSLENTLSAGGTVDQLTAQVAANTAAIALRQLLLPNGTPGDLLWWDPNLLTWEPLPPGANGHVLTVNSSVPSWTALPVSGGAVPEAPQDNLYYVRRNATWEELVGGSGITEAEADVRYVNVSGDTMAGALGLPAGTEALPAISFGTDPGSGIYQAAGTGLNNLTLSINGTQRMSLTGALVDFNTGFLRVGGSSATVNLDRASGAGGSSIINFRSGTQSRWAWNITGVESTGNAGANVFLQLFDDAGVLVSNYLQIGRASRQMGINGAAIGNATVGIRSTDGASAEYDGIEVMNTSTAADAYAGITFRTASGAVRGAIRGERPGSANTGDLGVWAATVAGTLSKVGTFRANGNLEVVGNVIANGATLSRGDDVLAFDFGSGAPTANQSLSVIMAHDVSIPNNFAGSRGAVLANPASSLVVPVFVGGVQRGTATVSTAGAFTFVFGTPGSPLAVTAGTRVTMTMPASIPANVTGFAASIITNRTS